MDSIEKIVLHNHKGGTGKSAFSFHLVEYLVEHGQECCLLDLDSQQNSISWVTGHSWGGEGSLKVPGDGDRKPLVATIEPSLAREHAPVVIDTDPGEEALEELADWDLVPGKGDLLICPVDGRFSIDGAIKVAEEVRDRGCRVIAVANKTDPRSGHGAEELRATRELAEAEDLCVEVFKMAIPENKKYVRRAELEGKPVWEIPYALRTHTARALEAFCRWVAQGAPKEANQKGKLGAEIGPEERSDRVEKLQDRLWKDS